ncbi:MAG: HAD family hydrolase [Lactobacillus sp.]|jgi:Cof subfamily protein (haloacid dehalogenase superfamily)|nr:HAD family hydrolase [Lactobacillus sp.]MCH3905584.1 HAD family hydrolase [Lactobacillus sp.]MCH3990857.1 HAD family hydrolase [Lactobacillus sp.]MCH4068427.1 HAD family hydrolase [Lactobacillus sp.]MCI1304567.1 HAD family hydrolase [Lactobacillus sp.]
MIKLIATDMDGTWLRPDKSYDYALFKRIFELMQERNIKFVVASSNQYENLRQRFPEVADQIYYIAENGGLIAAGDKILQTKTLTSAETVEADRVVEKYDYPLIWCGVKSAYILRREGPAYYQEMKQFFENLTAVEQFDLKNDRFFKTSLILDDGRAADFCPEIAAACPNLEVVCGSTYSIDISPLGMNKVRGLEYFNEQFGIDPAEMVAFGDSGNDVKMLQYAGIGYATGTAMDEAKEAADEVSGSSSESAVQKQILALLEN